jgi:sugar/nucleoside kinase (ribokinase family)
MTMPDPSSDQGRAPWRTILERVLPHVDLFLPSIDEASFMLAPHAGAMPPRAVADELLAMGASLVMLKMGESGLYLKTAAAPQMLFLEEVRQQPRIWSELELSAAAYEVNVAGTTGCGDSTIAGFLGALLRGLPPQEALDLAAAAGSCTAERPDALSGVPDWDSLVARIEAGWPRKTAVAR